MFRSCADQFPSDVRFQKNLATSEPAIVKTRTRRGWTFAGVTAAFAFEILTAMICAAAPAPAAGVVPVQNEGNQVAGEAERRLLADLRAARDAFADHYDPTHFARDLVAAFRRWDQEIGAQRTK